MIPFLADKRLQQFAVLCDDLMQRSRYANTFCSFTFDNLYDVVCLKFYRVKYAGDAKDDGTHSETEVILPHAELDAVTNDTREIGTQIMVRVEKGFASSGCMSIKTEPAVRKAFEQLAAKNAKQ